MKKINLLFVLFIGITFAACSSDDDSGDTQTVEEQNGFLYDGTFIATQHAFISDENTADDMPSDISIILSNIDPYQTEQSSDLDMVFFDFEAVTIEPGTITEFPDYWIIENAELNNMQIGGGNIILHHTVEGQMATSSTVTINSISETSIDLVYSFTREDGEIITGAYSGTYTDTSN